MTNAVQTVSEKYNTLKSYLESENVLPGIKQALPKYLTSEKLLSVVLSEVRNTPKLLECDKVSFANAIVQCSRLGLMPGDGRGQVYLIPYGKECTIMPGYRGYIVLAQRSRVETVIKAHCIYRNDEYKCLLGSEEKIIHIPALENRGDLIGVYAIAEWFKINKITGEKEKISLIDQLSLEDIEKAKNCSKCPDKVWAKWYPEMARKTGVRRISKYLDLSPEFNNLVDIDNKIDSGNAIEGEFETINPADALIPQNKKMLNKLKGGEGKKSEKMF